MIKRIRVMLNVIICKNSCMNTLINCSTFQYIFLLVMYLTLSFCLFYINQLHFIININPSSPVPSLKASFPTNNKTQ